MADLEAFLAKKATKKVKGKKYATKHDIAKRINETEKKSEEKTKASLEKYLKMKCFQDFSELAACVPTSTEESDSEEDFGHEDLMEEEMTTSSDEGAMDFLDFYHPGSKARETEDKGENKENGKFIEEDQQREKNCSMPVAGDNDMSTPSKFSSRNTKQLHDNAVQPALCHVLDNWDDLLEAQARAAAMYAQAHQSRGNRNEEQEEGKELQPLSTDYGGEGAKFLKDCK